MNAPHNGSIQCTFVLRKHCERIESESIPFLSSTTATCRITIVQHTFLEGILGSLMSEGQDTIHRSTLPSTTSHSSAQKEP